MAIQLKVLLWLQCVGVWFLGCRLDSFCHIGENLLSTEHAVCVQARVALERSVDSWFRGRPYEPICASDTWK